MKKLSVVLTLMSACVLGLSYSQAKEKKRMTPTPSKVIAPTPASSFEIEGTRLVEFIGSEKDVVIPEGLTVIESNAFRGCSSLTSVVIPEGVREIRYSAFLGCSSLTSVVIPDGVKMIGTRAFYRCSYLTSVVIPESVTEIGDYAFAGCPNLTIHALKGSKAEKYAKEKRIPFKDESQKNGIEVTEALSVTPASSFVIMGKVLKEFTGTETDVVIPEGVKEIGIGAFRDCRSLTSVVIPESVTKIGGSAFSGCRSLTSVVIPDSVKEIHGGAFRGCTALKEWPISSVNPYFKRDGVCLLTKDGEKLVACLSLAKKCRIPEGVTEIGECAFSGCSFLTSVVIPKDVEKIGEFAFSGCSSLTSVEIPDSVKEIGGGAFGGCTALKEWPISSEHPYFESDGAGLLTKDGKKLVACLATAMEYQIPEGVTVIGECAFEDCTSLTCVVIPEGVKEIRSSAFSGCSSLTSVIIPEEVKEIGAFAFLGCSSLTSVVIPKGVKVIGSFAFEDCHSLTSVEIPERVTLEIEYGVFVGCPKLTIHAPKGTEAERYAKYNKIPFEAK